MNKLPDIDPICSFLDLFQYHVDSSNQLRLMIQHKAIRTTPDIHPVADTWPKHCVPAQ